MRLLRELGYTRVRHFRGGLAYWKEAGGPLESGADRGPALPARAPRQRAARRRFHGRPGLRRSQWGNALVDLIERRSTSELFLSWLVMALLCGVFYWLCALGGLAALTEHGAPLDGGPGGLARAIYFSFVTATSVGYGDVLPVGPARALAVAEAAAGLLIFGAVVAKFVSRRQEGLVREIHRVSFEERLDRVQINLHVVLSELHAVAALWEGGAAPRQRIVARLESAVLVFAGELRTVHALLYRPSQEPDESSLEAILVSLASALEALSTLLGAWRADLVRSAALDRALGTLAALAREICGECVPKSYAPALTVWMDRVQHLAHHIA